MCDVSTQILSDFCIYIANGILEFVFLIISQQLS